MMYLSNFALLQGNMLMQQAAFFKYEPAVLLSGTGGLHCVSGYNLWFKYWDCSLHQFYSIYVV